MATQQKEDPNGNGKKPQSLLTKFFKPLNPSADRPYFEFLFEKEEADRKKREEEAKRKHLEELRKRAEARRLSRIEAKKKKDEQRRLLDEESRKKYEGKSPVQEKSFLCSIVIVLHQLVL